MGIIEPITYAMMAGFSTLPDELLEICKYAVKENDPFLKSPTLQCGKQLNWCN